MNPAQPATTTCSFTAFPLPESASAQSPVSTAAHPVRPLNVAISTAAPYLSIARPSAHSAEADRPYYSISLALKAANSSSVSMPLACRFASLVSSATTVGGGCSISVGSGSRLGSG